jgi:hypothetical protein
MTEKETVMEVVNEIADKGFTQGSSYPSSSALALIVLVTNVVAGCQFSPLNLPLADSLSITLLSEMMDITAPNPDCPVSPFGSSLTQLSFVSIVWEVAIEPCQFLPQTSAY